MSSRLDVTGISSSVGSATTAALAAARCTQVRREQTDNSGSGTRSYGYDGRPRLNCTYDCPIGLLDRAPEREAGFTGHRVESALGLSYAKRRWLDSSTGTWLSRDDIGAASRLSAPNGLNAWGYAAGNPNRFTDSDGRWESSADVVSWRDEKGYLDDRVPESRLRANRVARGVGAVAAAGAAACGLQPELCVIGAGFSGWQQAAGMADDVAASRPVRDTDYVALYLGGATGAVAGPVLGRASPVIQGAVVGGTTGLALRESFDRASAGDRYSAAFGLVTAAAGPALFLGPMLPPGRPGSFMEFIGRTGSPAGLTPQGFDVEIPSASTPSPANSATEGILLFRVPTGRNPKLPISASNPDYGRINKKTGDRGGRRGGLLTREDIDAIRDLVLDANPGWEHVAGGTDRYTGAQVPERLVKGPKGAQGGAYADLVFRNPQTNATVSLNTVDIEASGWMTDREASNFTRLYALTNAPVIAVPKPPFPTGATQWRFSVAGDLAGSGFVIPEPINGTGRF